MMLPAAAISVPLFAAFVLAALVYYKRDPVRRVACLPFALVATPLALLMLYEALQVGGFTWIAQSVVAFAMSIAILAVAVRQARCLLPKPKNR